MKTVTSVFVDGRRYPVVEHPGYLKAHLFGRHGWGSVWCHSGSYVDLVKLIRRALEFR